MYQVFDTFSNLFLKSQDNLDITNSGVKSYMYSFQTALLIDDDEIDTFINQKMLELTHFAQHIIVKNKAKQAIEFLQANSSTPEYLPEYIFLDLNMPEMDGFEFLDEFERLPAECKTKSKIIILSVSDDNDVMKKVLNNKYVYRQVSKPLMKQSITDLLAPAELQ